MEFTLDHLSRPNVIRRSLYVWKREKEELASEFCGMRKPSHCSLWSGKGDVSEGRRVASRIWKRPKNKSFSKASIGNAVLLACWFWPRNTHFALPTSLNVRWWHCVMLSHRVMWYSNHGELMCFDSSSCMKHICALVLRHGWDNKHPRGEVFVCFTLISPLTYPPIITSPSTNTDKTKANSFQTELLCIYDMWIFTMLLQKNDREQYV